LRVRVLLEIISPEGCGVKGSGGCPAAALAFLASDPAGFITRQTLSVSGGLTMA